VAAALHAAGAVSACSSEAMIWLLSEFPGLSIEFPWFSTASLYTYPSSRAM
jgi:hypothetical protein